MMAKMNVVGPFGNQQSSQQVSSLNFEFMHFLFFFSIRSIELCNKYSVMTYNGHMEYRNNYVMQPDQLVSCSRNIKLI